METTLVIQHKTKVSTCSVFPCDKLLSRLGRRMGGLFVSVCYVMVKALKSYLVLCMLVRIHAFSCVHVCIYIVIVVGLLIILSLSNMRLSNYYIKICLILYHHSVYRL